MNKATPDTLEQLFRRHRNAVIVHEPTSGVVRFANEPAADYFQLTRGELEQSHIAALGLDHRSGQNDDAPFALPGDAPSNRPPIRQPLPVELTTSDFELAGHRYRVVVIDTTGPASEHDHDLDQQRRHQQRQSLAQLAQDDTIANGRFPECLDAVLRSAAETLGVRRVGFWRVTDSPPGLCCERLYDNVRQHVSGGVFIDGEQCPNYLAHTAANRVLDASDAVKDERLTELNEYLRQNRIGSLLDAPIRMHGEMVGILCHEHVGPPRAWQEDEIRFAGEIADQLSQALLNGERRRYQELMTGMLSLVGPETGDEFCQALVTNIARVIDASRVFIAPIDPDDDEHAATLAMASAEGPAPNTALTINDPLCAAALRDGVAVVSHDLAYRYPDQPWGNAPDGASYIGMRLADRDGTILGILGAVCREPVTKDEDAVGLMRVFADRAAVELARLRQEPELLRAAAVLKNTGEGIAVACEDGQILEANPALASLTGYDIESLEQTSLFDLLDHPSPDILQCSVDANGTWRGEVKTRSARRDPFPAWLTLTRFAFDDLGATRPRIVALLSDISRVRESQAELEYLAHHDPLTRLPNRTLFRQRLQRALDSADRSSTPVGLLFLDIDGFKDVNDSLGHTEGDELLKQVAARLSEATGSNEMLARIGGDEFMVLLEAVPDQATAGDAAARLLSAFNGPYTVTEHEFFVTASIGISVYPHHGETVESLIQSADAAMYEAKAAGHNTFRFFTPALTKQAFDRVALVSALGHALENDNFHLCFQSQVALDGGRITGCEALVRWQRQDGETILPEDFLAAAERSGLIMAIGNRVLETACHQARAWLDEGLPCGRVAVNVTATQVSQTAFAEDLLAHLDRAGLPGEYLCLEITESLFLKPHAAIARTLAILRGAGVEIAIDDFGTGYSSLAYLKRLPIDTVKLDKSFTSDLASDSDNGSIAQAIVALAGNLGLDVIAEGIERAEDVDALAAMGCPRGQGFLYNHPMSATAYTALLREEAANAEAGPRRDSHA